MPVDKCEYITHRSDNWGQNSNEPAKGLCHIATECGFADAAETSRLCEQILSTDGNRFKTKGGDRT